MTLQNKTALITGVSRLNGIGFGIARRLAEQGADLFLHAFTPYDKMLNLLKSDDEAAQIRSKLEKSGVAVEQMEADFTDPDAPGQVMAATVKRFGHIDILILNHTYDTLKTLKKLTVEEIDRHLTINIRASLLLVQAFAERYDGSEGGRIIMLTSGQHRGPMPHIAYVASKGALHQLTASLSDALIDQSITVNTINPGPTRTYTPDKVSDESVVARMPYGRWGEPDDAARLIAWLVSDDARWVTGQVIDSEGGFRSS